MLRNTKLVVLLLFLGGALFLKPLMAIELILLNEVGEMAKSKKILLRVNFSAEERLIYREMLRFSSSNSKIQLRFWKTSLAAKSEYMAPFHQVKRVFVEPFDLELSFEEVGIEDNHGALIQELSQTSILISYVACTDIQKHKAETAVVHLNELSRDNLSSVGPVEHKTALALSFTTTVPAQRSEHAAIPLPSSISDDEIVYLKQGEMFYIQFYDLLVRIVSSVAPLFALVVLSFLLLLICLKIFIHLLPTIASYYPYRLAHVIFGLLPLAVSYFVGLLIEVAAAFIMLGGYCFIIGIYLLFSYREQEPTFSVKVLNLVGGIALFIALPLLLKGILLLFFA